MIQRCLDCEKEKEMHLCLFSLKENMRERKHIFDRKLLQNHFFRKMYKEMRENDSNVI